MTPPPEEAPNGKVTLVLLLSELWGPLVPAVFQDIVLRTFKKEVLVDGPPDGTEFAGGEFPLFFVQFDGFLFKIDTIPEPFFSDKEGAANSLGELRASKAVREHDAYIHISLMMAPEGADDDTQARLVGKMAAGLGWSEGTLAVFCPEISQVRVWEKSLRKMLRQAHPLTAFRDYVPSTKKEPVFAVDPSHPLMKAAVAEAKRRFPEFAAALARRGADDLFLVKVPFKDGDNLEHMWVEVTAFADGVFEGKLINEPVELKRFKKGARVRLKQGLVEDWMFKGERGLEGNFIEAAMRRIMEEEAARGEAADEDDDEEVDEGPAEQLTAAPPRRPPSPAPRPVPRQRSEPEPPGPNWRLIGLIAGGSILGVVLIVVVLGVAGVFSGPKDPDPPPGPVAQQPPDEPIGPPKQPEGLRGNSAEHAVREFTDALRAGDIDKALQWTSPALRQRLGADELRRLAAASFVGEKDAFRFEQPGGPGAAAFVVSTRSRKGPAAFTLIARDDPGGWLVTEFAAGATGIRRDKTSNSPEAVVNGFVGALRSGDFVSAYADTGDAYRQRVSLEQFRDLIDGTKLFGDARRREWRADALPEGGPPRWFVGVPGFHGPPPLTLHLRDGPGGYRIEDLTPGADKRTGRTLDRNLLVNVFTGTLRDGDPEAAYALTSAEFRKRTSTEQFRAEFAKRKAFADHGNLARSDPKEQGGGAVVTVRAGGQSGPAVLMFRVAPEAGGKRWSVTDVTFP